MSPIPFPDSRFTFDVRQRSGSEDSLRETGWALRVRDLGNGITDSTARSLIIVGITCGTLAAVVLIGIVAYLVIRHRRKVNSRPRHRHSVPPTSRIRNGYTRSRTESDTTIGSRKTTSTQGQPQGYFKSWSSRSKTAYLSVPMLSVTQSENVAPPERVQLGGYRYDPDSARGMPKKSKKKSIRERLRLDTSIIAPSPRLDLLSPTNPQRQSTLMQSATSPPPFAQYFPPKQSPKVGQPIRPRAELRLGDVPPTPPSRTGGATGFAGLGSFVPPPPPSWASFWPTESGWTGPGGVPSIRDEDFGSDSGESWEEKKARLCRSDDEDDRISWASSRKRKLDDPDGERKAESSDEEDDLGGGQYALDRRQGNYAIGPFRLTPKALRVDGRGRRRSGSESSRGTVSPSPRPPPSPEPPLPSPRLDLVDEYTRSTNDSTDDTNSLTRATTGKFTLAFGRPKVGRLDTTGTKSSSKSRRTPGHSRNASSVHLSVSRSGTHSSRPARSNTSRTGLTRSSTTRTDRTDATDQTMSPVSTVSGQILAALTGHVATPLLRSVDSLRRVYSGNDQGQDVEGGASEAPADARPSPSRSPSDSQPGSSRTGSASTPVRRLPSIPIPVPPVPPIPRHHMTEPRPLPVPGSRSSAVIPRSASLGMTSPTSPNESIARSSMISTSTRVASPPVRPLPMPPIPTQ